MMVSFIDDFRDEHGVEPLPAPPGGGKAREVFVIDGNTELVLVDWTDIANGYAQTIPVNTIVIFVTNPQENSTLGVYEDWMDGILTHEYSHILHLDTVEGIPKLLRYGLGRLVAPNQLSPGWVVEGQATYNETRFTPGGRSGDWVVWTLVALGAAAAVFLVWQSRWRDGP